MTPMKNTTIPYKLYSFSFWKAYFIQMRPYLLFVSGVVAWAGMSLVQLDNISTTQYLLTFIPLFLGYGFGQALTDCFQMDTDKISAPYRPLSQGKISSSAVFWVSISGLVAISSVLVYLNIWNALLCLLSILGLAAYSIVKRRYWFAGPFFNAFIVVLLPIMGFISLSGGFLTSFLDSTLLKLLVVTFFSYSSFVLIGYLKDISADKETGYQTIPVVYGWETAVWISDLFVILTIIFCYDLVSFSTVGIICFILASIVALSGHLYGHLTKEKIESNSVIPVSSTVRSLILWHSAIILAYNESLLFYVVAFYFLFELVFYFRPEKHQI
jgi:4-hydroxybenzoate polyprenyltransferase